MKIGIPKERWPSEKRVAASPETVKKLVMMGLTLLVETDAGHGSFFLDKAYEEAGASIVADPQALFGEADVIFKVQRPMVEPLLEVDEMSLLRPGQTLIAILDALVSRDQVTAYAEKKVTAFALELVPRISRAQSKQYVGHGKADAASDLIGPQGQCAAVAPAPAAPLPDAAGEPAAAAPALVQGGIALQMTECDVVSRAGQPDNIEFGSTERGERSVVLTYMRGPRPGIYRFAGGRLHSIERGPEPPAPPKKAAPAKKKRQAAAKTTVE